MRILLLTLLLVLPPLSVAQQDAGGETPDGCLAQRLMMLLSEQPYRLVGKVDWNRLDRLYGQRNFDPIWVADGTQTERAGLLYRTLQGAGEEGLDPYDYHLARIEQLWFATSKRELLDLELLLSDALMRYSSDLYRGRMQPSETEPKWHIERPDFDPLAWLQRVLAAGALAEQLPLLAPQLHGYRRLREVLARYRTIHALGGWPTIPAGESLRQGERGQRIALVRRRLQLEGYLNPAPVEEREIFDRTLRQALKRFQQRYGLEVSGEVGQQTLAALNVPVWQRIEQIKLNMERLRWLPRQLGERYIIVNIASYELTAYSYGEPVLTSQVIIGKPYRPTPVLKGLLHTVVLNPYWTVPPNLAVRDLIPRQRRDPDYMVSRKIRVFDDWEGEVELDPATIDWSKVTRNNFSYMLRQDPGPANPLGKVKFLFSNDFNVYLHDTPSRSLFQRNERAFSSGCVRVEKAVQLASYLLSGEDGWNIRTVQTVIDTGLTHSIDIKRSVNVYLLYLTVWVAEDGTVQFRPDIYGEDARLACCRTRREPLL